MLRPLRDLLVAEALADEIGDLLLAFVIRTEAIIGVLRSTDACLRCESRYP